MHSLFNPYFIGACLLYSLNKLFLYLNFYKITFLKNYLSDCLAMPILLSLALFLMRTLMKNKTYVFSIYQVVFAIVYVGVVFEFLGPKIFTGKTSDWYDLIAYATGAVFYLVFMNKGNMKTDNLVKLKPE